MKLVKIEGFYVEVVEEAPSLHDPADRGDEKTGGMRDAVSLVSISLKDSVGNLCAYIRDAFSHANHPDELAVEFGIKLTGETGIPFVSKGSTDATLKISVKWTASTRGTPSG